MTNQEALQLLRKALIAIDFYLLQTGNGGIARKSEQLKRIRANLEQMCAEIETHHIARHNFGIARQIVDSWPFSTKLGELLIQAEHAYLISHD